MIVVAVVVGCLVVALLLLFLLGRRVCAYVLVCGEAGYREPAPALLCVIEQDVGGGGAGRQRDEWYTRQVYMFVCVLWVSRAETRAQAAE